jgi:DNA repair protein RadC
MRIKDMALNERPRERLMLDGPDKLSSGELIAILLRTGLQGRSAVAIGDELITRYHTLRELAMAPREELRKVKGIGHDKAAMLSAAFTLARRMAEELRHEKPVLDSPEAVADLMREHTRIRDREVFEVLLVDVRRRLLGVHKVADGLLDTVVVHPREVFRSAITANAAGIILTHNHPSGDPSPSEADIKVTRDLLRCGQMLRIEVHDHVILGSKTEARPKDYMSLRELGYFYT